MSSKCIVRAVTIEDYEPAAVFLEKATGGRFTKDFWMDRFEYWWEKNPAMTDDTPRAWILRGDNGEIGGFLGNIPVKYSIHGEEKNVCSVTSWYVDPRYRLKSLELLIPFLKQTEPYLLLDTSPIGKVVDMLTKLGFVSLEKKWLKRDFFYPVNLMEFWKFFIRKNIANKILTFLFDITGLIVIPALKIIQLSHTLSLPSADKGYSFNEIKRFDKSYTSLWDKLKTKYEVIAVRNETTFNWFFFGSDGLLSTRKVIEVKYRGEIVGYAAVKEIEFTSNDKSFYYFEVIDMVIFIDDMNVYYVLLNGLLWLAKKSDKKIIFVMVNSFVDGSEAILKKYGFMARKGKSKILCKSNIGLKPAASDSYSFYVTPLDGDRCFFP